MTHFTDVPVADSTTHQHIQITVGMSLLCHKLVKLMWYATHVDMTCPLCGRYCIFCYLQVPTDQQSYTGQDY